MSAITAAPLSIVRTIQDFDTLAKQPPAVVADILRKVGWIQRLAAAGYGQAGPIMAAACAELEASQGTVYKWMQAFKADNWRGLLDGRAGAVKGLPPLFKSHVSGVWDSHQRGSDDGAEVQRVLLDQWHLWRATHDPKHKLPGYSTPPPADPATGYPAGWSLKNIRRLRPRKVELALAKHGQKAASKFLPPVLTTRIGSAVLSRVLFDDQDYDNLLADGFLAIAGIPNTTRPVSFNCLDFYTARHLDNHLRLAYKDTASDTTKTLTGKEFAWFTIKQLLTLGYRTDSHGTEYIFEHGTANSWSNKDLTTLGGHHSFEAAVEALTAGHVYINRSGKFEGPLFANLCFQASSTGNFKFKTWIESSFRLLRIYMQALPGPTGSFARINGKEETYGIQLAENRLLTVVTNCPDRSLQEFLVENLRHELLDLTTFAALVAAVYRAINLATLHNLEGWRQCGFTVPLWRLKPDSETWFAQSELQTLFPDPEERQLIIRRINADPRLTKIDLMSRDEAYALCYSRDRHLITRLPDQMVAHLLPMEWAVAVTVGANHAFTLPNLLWADSRETYVASWEERNGRVTLDGGTKLRVYHNPFTDGRAQVHAADGSYITTLYPTARAQVFDAAQKLEQLKVRSSIKSGHEAHLRARMEAIGDARTDARTANQEMVKTALDLTREDRRRTKTAARSAAAVQGHRTAAANRLQDLSEPTDWDSYQPDTTDPEIRSAWDDLPEEIDLPDAF
jgi:hypothetical protein